MTVLTIVIVNYNSTRFLEGCLTSVFEGTALDSFRVVVIDNASIDRDFSALKRKFPAVTVLLNETNRGFAAACNQGLSHQPARFYLLLNPDCIMGAHAIDKCVKFLEQHPSAGIVGCRVNNPDGSLQLACRRQIPRPSTALYRFLGLSRLFPNTARVAAYNLGHLDPQQTHEVEAVSGSFLMFRDEVLQDTGGLDERFFLYGEDLDFCYESSMNGWKIFYFPQAEVTHYKNVSFLSDPRRSTYHFYQAMEIFYRKHFYADAGLVEKMLVLAGIRLLYAGKRLQQTLLRRSEIGPSW